jgi:MSHA biogenesis protein MshJ
MTLFLRDLMDRFDQLSLRERIIVLVATLLLVALIWDSVFMAPLDRDRKGRLQQVEALRAEVTGLEQSVETLVAQGAANPVQSTGGTANTLAAEIQELDRRLVGATSGLIKPTEMSHVLEQVLARAQRLTLRTLRTLPPQAVAAPDAQPGAPSAQIYKHGVELELSGDYMDTLYFLQALEALPWRFFWDRVEYVAGEGETRGRLTLRLYTLGLEEAWIGV